MEADEAGKAIFVLEWSHDDSGALGFGERAACSIAEFSPKNVGQSVIERTCQRARFPPEIGFGLQEVSVEASKRDWELILSEPFSQQWPGGRLLQKRIAYV